MGIALNFVTCPCSELDHGLFMFDVGHGDCVLIVGNLGRGLLIDCGSREPRRYSSIPSIIENSHFIRECGFVVSHYHWDHYSLFRGFANPEKFFSTVYLPDLPLYGPGIDASFAMMDFMMVSVLANFSHYRILPEIFEKVGVKHMFCRKGYKIHEADLPLKVFWPDFFDMILQTRSVKATVATMRSILEPIMDHHDIRKPSQMPQYSMESFFRDIQREDLRYRRLREQERKEICDTLERIEKSFNDLANIFSLAFRTHYKRKSRFLFLGDLEGSILNKISIPGTGRYECVKSSHHGTEFGSALNCVSTKILLVSRNEKYRGIRKIDDGYIHKLPHEKLLSTGFLGNCNVQ
jgi:ribonuclease BN (tRNA processing enzyme)